MIDRPSQEARTEAFDAEIINEALALRNTMIGTLVYQYRNRELAEEAVQIVYLRLVKHYATITSSERFDLKAWLFTVLRNVARDLMRKKFPLPFVDCDDLQASKIQDTRSHVASSVITELIDEEETRRFWDALEMLQPRHRQVLTMQYMKRMTGVELADAFGISPDRVHRLAYDARHALRTALADLREAEDGLIT